MIKIILSLFIVTSTVYAQDKFFIPTPDSCHFSTSGKNDFFILEPGYKLELAGVDGRDSIKLFITVLNETKQVGKVLTRVVEEREYENGEIIEISRNYLALCKESSDIWYFGEDVDMYEDGKVVSHEGAWLATGNNKAGILMPGNALPGRAYYQEYAPGIAMDRAEIILEQKFFETPAGKMKNCLMTLETTPLKPKEKEYKVYAKNIGLIRDGNLLLVSYGKK